MLVQARPYLGTRHIKWLVTVHPAPVASGRLKFPALAMALWPASPETPRSLHPGVRTRAAWVARAALAAWAAQVGHWPQPASSTTNTSSSVHRGPIQMP